MPDFFYHAAMEKNSQLKSIHIIAVLKQQRNLNVTCLLYFQTVFSQFHLTGLFIFSICSHERGFYSMEP